MAEPKRRSIPLDRNGMALLGEALLCRNDLSRGELEELSRAVGMLKAEGSLTLYDQKKSARPLKIRPENVTARSFRWLWWDYEEYPALLAFCIKELPAWADHIDQETPIATRPKFPRDDLIKTLFPIFADRFERLSGVALSIAKVPIREETFYRKLRYWREVLPETRGTLHWNDGCDRAAILAEYYHQSNHTIDRKFSKDMAAAWAVWKVGWVHFPEDRNREETTHVFGVSRQDAVKRVRLRMREIAREDEHWLRRRWKAVAQIEIDQE